MYMKIKELFFHFFFGLGLAFPLYFFFKYIYIYIVVVILYCFAFICNLFFCMLYNNASYFFIRFKHLIAYCNHVKALFIKEFRFLEIKWFMLYSIIIYLLYLLLRTHLKTYCALS